MIIEYEKDYLEELYQKGKCKNKKYRLQIITTKRSKRIWKRSTECPPIPGMC